MRSCWLCLRACLPFLKVVALNGTVTLSKKKQSCSLRGETGMALPIIGKDLCVGKVRTTQQSLCAYIITVEIPEGQWAIHSQGWWLVPCSNSYFIPQPGRFCVMVLVFPNVNYLPSLPIDKRRPKHKIIATITVALGSIWAGTGIATVFEQRQGINELRMSIDQDRSFGTIYCCPGKISIFFSWGSAAE